MTTDRPSAGACAPSPPADAFRFGRNWQRYLARDLDEHRERIAAESLEELVGDLRGKTFLDIGCGSGLFSLCAYRAGASRIVSLDVDADSVAATASLRQRVRDPEHWEVLHRSILSEELGSELPHFDVVYSWGVLHHTGRMYPAIYNASQFVAPGGIFAIAIYNCVTDRWLDSARWLKIKRAYNHSSRPTQRAMEGAYASYWLLGRLRSRQNPVTVAREYRRSRGMALWTDMVDWLGGYPYEFASVPEITAFCEGELGLSTTHVISVSQRDTGNNQFVFRRSPRES